MRSRSGASRWARAVLAVAFLASATGLAVGFYARDAPAGNGFVYSRELGATIPAAKEVAIEKEYAHRGAAESTAAKPPPPFTRQPVQTPVIQSDLGRYHSPLISTTVFSPNNHTYFSDGYTNVEVLAGSATGHPRVGVLVLVTTDLQTGNQAVKWLRVPAAGGPLDIRAVDEPLVSFDGTDGKTGTLDTSTGQITLGPVSAAKIS